MLEAANQVATGLRKVPFGAPASELMKIIDEDGGVIVEDILSQAQLDEVNAGKQGISVEAAKAGSGVQVTPPPPVP